MEEPVVEQYWTINVPVLWVTLEPTVKVRPDAMNLSLCNFNMNFNLIYKLIKLEKKVSF